MKSLMPWKWGAKRLPVTQEEQYHHFYSLQREMNKLFDDFFGGMEFSMPQVFEEEQLSQFQPKVDLKETDKDIVLTIEVPGMSQKDIEMSVSDNMLTIAGEKKEEREENVKGYYRMERKYGAFQRSIPLPCEINKEQAEAEFKHGVITVTLPKTKQATSQTRKVDIKSA